MESPLKSRWERIRQHTAFDVGAVYFGICWLIVQAAQLFLGLEPRALRWLAGVLAAGAIPVIAFAVRTERRRSARIEIRRSRLNWMLGAALLLFVVGGGVWLVRSRQQLSSGADLIAVLPFKVTSTDISEQAALREGLMDLLAANLNQISSIQTITPRTVMRAARKTNSAGLDLGQALEIGEAVGARSVLRGEVVRIGDRMRLAAELYRLDGVRVARAQADGAHDDVLGLIDSLTIRLLREVWKADAPIPHLRVAAVTSGSIEAVAAYLEGERLLRGGQLDSAVHAFERATERDTTFAMALARLAESRGWAQHTLAAVDADVAMTAALRHAASLPARERSLLTLSALHQSGDVAVFDTLDTYLARYPADDIAWWIRCDAQFDAAAIIAASVDDLFATCDHAIQLDSTMTPVLIHPIELALAENDHRRFDYYISLLRAAGGADELAAYETNGKLHFTSDDSLFAVLRGALRDSSPMQRAAIRGGLTQRIFFTTRNPDIALAALDSFRASFPTDDQSLISIIVAKASIVAGLGQLTRARAILDTASATFTGSGASAVFSVFAGYAGETFLDSAQRRRMGDTVQVPGRAGLLRIWYALSQHDIARAQQLIQRWPAGSSPSPGVVDNGLLLASTGWAAAMTGDATTGIRNMRAGLRAAGYTPTFAYIPLFYELAVAQAARRETREEGIRRLRAQIRIWDFTHTAVSWEALGRALTAAGDSRGAVDAYEHFIRLWQNADASLQPRVAAARKEVARLSAQRR
jgi:TolB-like protein